MAQAVIQSSFNSGEWADALNARVDLQKYHSGAALMENWIVDYRGGASTRPGTKYIQQAFISSAAVRITTFQVTFTLGFLLEWGDNYLRFYNNGVPVLETGIAITGATQANPCVVSVVNTWSIGDWVFISGVGGMTELNGKYFRINARTGGTITLGDLQGTNINSLSYGAYSGGGTVARVYTLTSPYNPNELFQIKFVTDNNTMILTHPDHEPYVLTYTSANNWTLLPADFGTIIDPPTGLSGQGGGSGSGFVYSYVVTSIAIDGQESIASVPVTLTNRNDIRTSGNAIEITWSPVSGAIRYNVYKSVVSLNFNIPAGASYGYVGQAQGITFIDDNIAPDFSVTPPIAQNPFTGAGIASFTVTNAGTYTTVPTVSIAGTGGAIGNAILGVVGTPTVSSGGAGYAVGNTITFSNGVVVTVATVAAGAVSTVTLTNPGAIASGSTPANPLSQVSSSGGGTGAQITATWGVVSVIVIAAGVGYTVAPAVTFSSGAAAATAVLDTPQSLNPAVPAFYNQRLFLGAPDDSPSTFFMSQPGASYNFNISSPIQPDDAITASLVGAKAGQIKSALPMPSGLIVFTDQACWQINGGSEGAAVTPATIVANPHSYIGANDMPPIVVNFDILFVQAKGSVVRDLSYNFYSNVFTGTDITIQSSHLFLGYELVDWAWAEEPYKIVWVVRSDGVLLTLTFLKEQEFIGWSHSTTDEGNFKSVATVTEELADGTVVDAVYVVIARTINSVIRQYIERFVERVFPNGVVDAWCVDSGIRYSGAPATTFSGAEHLAGLTVTALADGEVINPFVMPANGTFTLATAASLVTVGIPYVCDLQTLAIDTGSPTIQGRLKKLPNVVVRVKDTLGLRIGTEIANLVAMKDLVRGNVGSQSNEVVTDLVTTDAETFLDPKWDPFGQYLIRQRFPLPATVLGVIPYVLVGDEP